VWKASAAGENCEVVQLPEASDFGHLGTRKDIRWRLISEKVQITGFGNGRVVDRMRMMEEFTQLQ